MINLKFIYLKTNFLYKQYCYYLNKNRINFEIYLKIFIKTNKYNIYKNSNNVCIKTDSAIKKIKKSLLIIFIIYSVIIKRSNIFNRNLNNF